ncbi:hypothetical protein U9M48_014963 [Paspalum notatum var. saurae]|uniref:Uncharacterized protein n=1 Tax=Paspalum notatum var. saurae TaxID=547442 RepID=A0AAQ3T282_PASNO
MPPPTPAPVSPPARLRGHRRLHAVPPPPPPSRSSHAPSAHVARPSKPPHPRQPCHQASPRIPPSFPALAGPLRRRHWPNFGPHHRDLATVTGATLQIAAAPRHPVLRHLVPEHLLRLLCQSPPSIESQSPRIRPPPCLHSASSTSPSLASSPPPHWAPCPPPALQCREIRGELRASPSPCRDAPAPAWVHAPPCPRVHPAEGRRRHPGGDTGAGVGGGVAGVGVAAGAGAPRALALPARRRLEGKG